MEETMNHLTKIVCLSIVMIGLMACSSTTFTTHWKATDAELASSMSGQKVLAFVLAKNDATRRTAEDALAAELTKRGAQGVAGYTIVPDVSDEAKAKELVGNSGFASVVSMRPVSVEKELIARTVADPTVQNYWGGYYASGWNSAYPQQETITNTFVSVETLVFSLKQNRLLWSQTTKTTNPTKIENFVKEIVEATVKEMKKDGLI
jgi:hypothetical protein